MTNYEKIKNMTVDEMARSDMTCFCCPYRCDIRECNDNCIECTRHWLESEAESD